MGLSLTFLALAGVLAVAPPAPAHRTMTVAITPAASGRQLVRVSLPLPRGLLREKERLEAVVGRRVFPVGLRVLTWHPVTGAEPLSARRALVTFPYTFSKRQPETFALRPRPARKEAGPRLPVTVATDGSRVVVRYADGPTVVARLNAPPRESREKPKVEVVEENPFYLWQRVRLNDSQWPRLIEIRADALGSVVVVAHLQRYLPQDGYAPDFGWEIAGNTTARLEPAALYSNPESFGELANGALLFHDGQYRLTHPTAPYRRQTAQELPEAGENGFLYRYQAYRADLRVPMQPTSWRRAEFVVQPVTQAPLTVTLESPHGAQVDGTLWEELYGVGKPPDLSREPELAALLRYHHEATVRTVARGDDFGNVTGYNDASRTGGAFGMNRLNHNFPIFAEAYRSGDRRLRDVAMLWCENFYDQSLWWGTEKTGGTRYNNMRAQGKIPPNDDQTYMWRSNDSVSFCTKGYDAFFVAYEQTGDPRMKEALDAQVRYAASYLDAGLNYTRNIGDVRDFLNLYRWTGERRYLDEALRLFRDLRVHLSTGDLFTESGQPIVPDPPFIDDDQVGPRTPYAKPYIIGYALAGLPELARLLPEEPKLRAVVQAVADFLAESEDPLGGWRYPHPRSSYLILSQGMEHAWQLTQAARLLGPQERLLDAIERVLRQRLHGWRKTGQVFGGLSGWEMATGKIQQRSELYTLYKRPADRDFTRDYTEGQPEFGGSSPEGIVYFPEVLAYYLQHRPASRLTAPSASEDPLARVLARARRP